MQEVIWTVFGWICKGIVVLMLISAVCYFVAFICAMAMNDGRKWYYYDPGKPWKGGYWAPLLPDYPPYNEYKWNPQTYRFEHKASGEPLHNGQKCGEMQSRPSGKSKPEWLRFLFDETPASLLEKRRRRKWAEEREAEIHQGHSPKKD